MTPQGQRQGIISWLRCPLETEVRDHFIDFSNRRNGSLPPSLGGILRYLLAHTIELVVL